MTRFRVSLVCGLLLFSISAATFADTDEEERRYNRRVLQYMSKNRCTGLHGLHWQRCMHELRTEETHNSAPERTAPTVNRRLEALRERARRKRSVLVPRHVGEYRTVDLSGSLRRNSLTSWQKFNQLKKAADADQTPRLRTRAKAGIRKAGTRTTKESASAQLCRRNKGVRLINCLLGFGVQINDRTVDKNTLQLWNDRVQD